jgi:hypothetical protein
LEHQRADFVFLVGWPFGVQGFFVEKFNHHCRYEKLDGFVVDL